MYMCQVDMDVCARSKDIMRTGCMPAGLNSNVSNAHRLELISYTKMITNGEGGAREQ